MTVRKIIVCSLLILCLCMGCGRKQEDVQQPPESSSAELTLPQIPPKLPVSYKPTSKEIQVALQNAGLYKGKIDGDIGPMSERAIREFQAENNLAVDGKIGPKTWAALKKYLDQAGE